ncbi:MTRF1L release factor glutamine methyltransferase-like isoform X2 [Antedon mediterranea]|uniref:MTRF1L release factor glutamine methyltransferase-like isoform X2 n=1 Tax=Antedon mediterranea TaxID=105859 RepID=UPI003AF762B1
MQKLFFSRTLCRRCCYFIFGGNHKHVYPSTLLLDAENRSLNSNESHPCTPKSLIQHWTAILKSKFVPDYEHDVKAIVLHTLKGTASDHILDEGINNRNVSLHKKYEQQISVDLISEINKLCNKRANRMPLQYVIGEWDFRELTLTMAPPVFIPRPETEVLVDQIKDYQLTKVNNDNMSFLEIGCGSGAISLSLLQEFPNASAVAIDSSNDAVKLTLENCKRYHCADRLRVYQHHLGTIYPEFLLSLPKFDFIVSNPPYVFTDDMDKLQPEISRYEDHSALDGGIDGLNVIKRIIHLARFVLKPSGVIWFETDSKHPQMIKNWLEKQPQMNVKYITSFTDFNERPRFVQLCYKPAFVHAATNS